MSDSESDRWELHRQISPGALQLEATELENLLPIPREKLLLDRVLSLRPGAHAVAEKAVSAGPKEQQFRGRQEFTFPSTVAFSALEQLSLVVLISDLSKGQTIQVPALVSIDSLEVAAEMLEPGLLHLHVMSKGKGTSFDGDDGVVRFMGGATVNGEDFVKATWAMKITSGP